MTKDNTGISWEMGLTKTISLIVIMLVAAIITPPDLMTLILVTIPLYLLYEVSIRVVSWVEPTP